MLGAIADEWAHLNSGGKDDLLLNAFQFQREIAREKIRSSRRGIPFCVVSIELNGTKQSRRRRRMLVRFLHRRLRMTDQKGRLGPNKFAALLVDTDDFGGQCVVDRLKHYSDLHDLDLHLDLSFHDPGICDGNDDDAQSSDERRTKRLPSARWSRIDGGVAAIDPTLERREVMKMAAKRTLDIVGASVGLVFGAPMILGAMGLVKFTSPGPALFKQTREGKDGRPFTIYKMRTMVQNAEKQQAELREISHRDGPAFKIERDPRVTTIGRILRATCVDELPQLWNVLKGDMSLVGPRPLPWRESRACRPWHRRRLDVRPGMTCYWQVDKEQAKDFDEWMRLDLKYVDNFSFFRDLGLIVKTFVVPLTGQGGK